MICIKERVVHCFTSLGKEYYHEEMFELVKYWDKYLNANNDCEKK
jgi:hypothetical protein